MLKKILFIFTLITLSLWRVFADSIPVEEVFSDIDSDYKYISELQTLYDKWMISPDSDWKFNPYQLLTREEFVWITMEVSCKNCIKPYTDYSFIEQYTTKPFYDVWLDNKYFYCISEAQDKNYIKWYDLSYTCDDWTYSEWERPFCTQNNIILEEALAIILRVSWILTNQQAQDIRDDIVSWIITEDLADDVSPKNLDGSVYSFYPDFQKALEYEVVDYDQYWNRKSYYLVEIVDWKLRPKFFITKEEFLRIAFVALKANNCIEKDDDNLWLEMNIYDSSCTEWSNNCELSTFLNDDIYDFEAIVSNSCSTWIKNPEWYIWRFYNRTTLEEIIKYWKYIDNYEFLTTWEWQIFLRVIDNCWNTSEVQNSISISDWNDDIDDLIVSIEAEPNYWVLPLYVDLTWVVIWGNGPYTYEWDFWDGTLWFWKNVDIIYKNEWIYEVVLKVTDSDWNIEIVNTFIEVFDNNQDDIEEDNSDQDNNEDNQDEDSNNDEQDNNDNIDNDTDWDWVRDLDDDCPLVDWEAENNWCPIIWDTCSSNSNCSSWFYCDIDTNPWVCRPTYSWDDSVNPNLNSTSLCNYSWWSLITWNIICETCPCSNYLDFISKLRNCDIIFPAITSPDNTTIYSKWDFYQIR